jgi:hypothetical protein
MEYVMQLSNDTINVLKNFGAINQGILFKKGKVLKTMSSGKNILAEVTIKEDIPTEFGIYDLNKFLSVVSLHKDNPTFEFGDKEVKIVGNKGRSKMKYRFCEPTMIVTPPEKQLAMPNPEVSFSLSAEDFDWIMKAAGVLGSPQIAVESDGSKVTVTAFDSSDSSAHTDALEVSSGNGDKFRFIFKTEHLTKLFGGAYDVQISSKGISNFKHKTVELQYWISTETGSTFTKAA